MPSAPAAPRRPARSQRGVAVVAVVIVLLVAMTLAASFVNRSLVFEQRGVSNRYRAIKAAEAAEAGLEWARVMLDASGQAVNQACLPIASGPSFRDIALRPDPSGAFRPDSDSAMACLLAPGGLRCTCTLTAAPSLSIAGLPVDDTLRFDVRFAPVPGDARAVAITAYGCTDAAVPCRSEATAPLQSVAMAGVTLKALDPAAASGPAPAAGSSAAQGTASAAVAAVAPATSASAAPALVTVSGSWHDVPVEP